MKTHKLLDLRRLRCPENILMIRRIIREMIDGQILLIITNDKLLYHDIYKLCKFMNHTLIQKKITKLPYQFIIRKGI